jgi:hypothetical protein
MIYCPKCGTANRDGSKFCNECGEKLSSQTQVKCPQCGVLNSVQSVFCRECGGRLLSPTTTAPSSAVPQAIKGLSLPTKASIGGEGEERVDAEVPEADDEVPAWLKELGATLSTDKVGGPAFDEEAAEVPDWLQDLRASLPEEPEPQVVEPGEAEKAEVPDWLADVQPSAPQAGPEPEALVPEEIEEAQAPDWLVELQPTAPEA